MNQLYFSPKIFSRFPEIVAAHSFRNTEQPADFSMLAKGATEEIAKTNRLEFAKQLGFSNIASPQLAQADSIYELSADFDDNERPEADAIIADIPNQLIGVGVADCIVVILYDPTHKVIAAVHSGWRGTKKSISGKVIQKLAAKYNCKPVELIAYLSPAPNRFEFEIGAEVAELFAPQYVSPKDQHKFWLDNKFAVHDQLLKSGLKPENIEVSPKSSYDQKYHSARRDKELSGRHMVVIGLT